MSFYFKLIIFHILQTIRNTLNNIFRLIYKVEYRYFSWCLNHLSKNGIEEHFKFNVLELYMMYANHAMLSLIK